MFLFAGFHHFGLPGHLAAGHEWRTLANRPGFPPAPFFHHQPPHFPPHMLALDRVERAGGLSIANRKFSLSFKRKPICSDL